MPPKIYYLDDEELLCKQAKIFLERKGLQVCVFTDAAAAIEACRNDPPEVLFVDYRLADTTGDQVAAAVDQRIKKVLVTGELTIGARDAFCVTLRKPYRLQQVYELALRLLQDESGGV